MNYIVRETEARDASALLDHIHKVASETDNLSFGKDDFNISSEKEARFIDRFKNSSRDLMLVALDGETVVGNGIIEREKIKRFSHRAELSITVLKDYWGQGIGSLLMKKMLDFCKESGVSVVTLYVRGDNDRAIALYRKFGFTDVGTFRNYFSIDGKLHDALFMQKII